MNQTRTLVSCPLTNAVEDVMKQSTGLIRHTLEAIDIVRGMGCKNEGTGLIHHTLEAIDIVHNH